MSWKRHISRGHTEDVEDSIQYLRRELEDIGPVGRQSSSLFDGDNDENLAAGVLPATATATNTTDCRGEGNIRPMTGIVHNRIVSPTRERHNEGGGSPSWRGDVYNRSSFLQRNEGFAHAERQNLRREYNPRGTLSPLRPPLRLLYASSTPNPIGRPPLRQYRNYHQDQQQRQSRQETKNVPQEDLGFGRRRVDDDPPPRDDVSEREGRHERSESLPEDFNSLVNRPRRSYVDPYEATGDVRAETSSYGRRRSLREDLLVNNGNKNIEKEYRVGEGGLGRRSPRSNNLSTTITGNDSRQHYNTANHELLGGGGKATASASPASEIPAVREGGLNGVSTLNKKHSGNIQRRNLFPYPAHEDNLRSIIFYLKNQYAMEPEESLRGIETMRPEDVLGLAQCFYVEVYRVVRDARIVAGVGRAGFTDGDPDMDCVMDSLGDRDTRAKMTEEKEDTEEEEEEEDTAAPSPPPPPPSSALPQTSYRESSPRVAANYDITAARGLRGRSSSPQRSRVSVVKSASDVNNSVLSKGTGLSLDVPPEPGKGILRRSLKELMPLLRRGTTLCKHVANGNPHMRFFRVEDNIVNYKGEEALMPHFAWYPSSASQKPTETLPLVNLVGVHLLLADEASCFRRLFRRKKGVVIDHKGRPVANGMCVVFRFKNRDVAVSFLAEEDRQLWVGGMMGVVERNREMTFQIH